MNNLMDTNARTSHVNAFGCSFHGVKHGKCTLVVTSKMMTTTCPCATNLATLEFEPISWTQSRCNDSVGLMPYLRSKIYVQLCSQKQVPAISDKPMFDYFVIKHHCQSTFYLTGLFMSHVLAVYTHSYLSPFLSIHLRKLLPA